MFGPRPAQPWASTNVNAGDIPALALLSVDVCLLGGGIERALETSPWALPICRLPRMKLTVIAANGKKDYDGKCEVESGGVLKITQADPGKPIIRLSPAFWREVHESADRRGPPSGVVRAQSSNERRSEKPQ
jgi:hypothetical protein